MLKRNSRHVPCRSTTSGKIFMFTIEYAKLQCNAVDADGSQIILNYLWWEPSISFQNVKKPAKECYFSRNYSVVPCSFDKNKTSS